LALPQIYNPILPYNKGDWQGRICRKVAGIFSIILYTGKLSLKKEALYGLPFPFRQRRENLWPFVAPFIRQLQKTPVDF